MYKNIKYYIMVSIPIFLATTQFEIFSINVGDLVILFYMSVILMYSKYERKKIEIKGFFNIYIILFIFLTLVCIFRGAINKFNTNESILGNKLVVKYVKYIKDRENFSNFFRTEVFKDHIFMYIRFILLFIVMPFGAKIISYINKFWLYAKKGIFFSIIINLIISIQDIILGKRITGLLGHAQDISAISILYIAIELNNSKVSKVKIFIAILGIYFSGTRSAIFSALVLVVAYYLRNKKINISKYVVILSIITSFLVSYSEKISNFILLLFSYITDSWDLMIRFKLWSKVFFEIFKSNILFGATAFPTFADNILWWIFLPFGMLGVILFLIIFIRESYIAYKNKNYIQQNLIIILFSQGILFNGFLGEHFILLWGFLYGASKVKNFNFKKVIGEFNNV